MINERLGKPICTEAIYQTNQCNSIYNEIEWQCSGGKIRDDLKPVTVRKNTWGRHQGLIPETLFKTFLPPSFSWYRLPPLFPWFSQKNPAETFFSFLPALFFSLCFSLASPPSHLRTPSHLPPKSSPISPLLLPQKQLNPSCRVAREKMVGKIYK